MNKAGNRINRCYIFGVSNSLDLKNANGNYINEDTLSRARVIRKAAWIGIIGNAILAVMKISVGFVSGSYAVIGDGIDSTTDVALFFITLVAAGIIQRPLDPKYPYGYNKAEAIATKLLSFVIFFVGAQLLITSIGRIWIHGDGEHQLPQSIAIYVTLISIIGKIILSRWQFSMGRKIESDLILANAKNMQNDIITSVSVLLGLGFTFFLKLPVLDLITAIIVSLWIIKSAYDIFMESNLELMDGVKDTSIYKDIIDAVHSVEGASNPHRIRIRKSAHRYVIALDIEVDPELNITEAHRITKNVEEEIRGRIQHIYDIVIHTEPSGNVEAEEQGIHPDML